VKEPEPITDLDRRLAEVLRRERVRRGWSQADLATRASLQATLISNLERQERRFRLDHVIKLWRELFDLDVEEMLVGSLQERIAQAELAEAERELEAARKRVAAAKARANGGRPRVIPA